MEYERFIDETLQAGRTADHFSWRRHGQEPPIPLSVEAGNLAHLTGKCVKKLTTTIAVIFNSAGSGDPANDAPVIVGLNRPSELWRAAISQILCFARSRMPFISA
jgi:hypothetical protein